MMLGKGTCAFKKHLVQSLYQGLTHVAEYATLTTTIEINTSVKFPLAIVIISLTPPLQS